MEGRWWSWQRFGLLACSFSFLRNCFYYFSLRGLGQCKAFHALALLLRSGRVRLQRSVRRWWAGDGRSLFGITPFESGVHCRFILLFLTPKPCPCTCNTPPPPRDKVGFGFMLICVCVCVSLILHVCYFIVFLFGFVTKVIINIYIFAFFSFWGPSYFAL
jgi:hypothetical protein